MCPWRRRGVALGQAWSSGKNSAEGLLRLEKSPPRAACASSKTSPTSGGAVPMNLRPRRPPAQLAGHQPVRSSCAAELNAVAGICNDPCSTPSSPPPVSWAAHEPAPWWPYTANKARQAARLRVVKNGRHPDPRGRTPSQPGRGRSWAAFAVSISLELVDRRGRGDYVIIVGYALTRLDPDEPADPRR